MKTGKKSFVGTIAEFRVWLKYMTCDACKYHTESGECTEIPF